MYLLRLAGCGKDEYSSEKSSSLLYYSHWITRPRVWLRREIFKLSLLIINTIPSFYIAVLIIQKTLLRNCEVSLLIRQIFTFFNIITNDTVHIYDPSKWN